MTNGYFESMKANLVEVYKTELCEESLVDIENASNVAEFIAVLKKYAAFLKYKNIPKIEWVHEWFYGEYVNEANENGCYIDQYAFVKNPKLDLVLYGNSNINICVDEANIFNVCVQDNSVVNVLVKNFAHLNVRLKDNGKCKQLYKDNTAVLKIRNV